VSQAEYDYNSNIMGDSGGFLDHWDIEHEEHMEKLRRMKKTLEKESLSIEQQVELVDEVIALRDLTRI